MRNKAAFRVVRIATAIIAISFAGPAFAKDTPVDLEKCPAPVQAVVRQYLPHGRMEKIAFDEKKKSGGSPVYEAKFTLRDGKRIELHISPEGRLLQVENKAPKY